MTGGVGAGRLKTSRRRDWSKDQASEVMGFKHYSIRTERTYREWIRRSPPNKASLGQF